MWKLSLILLIAGVYNWYANNSFHFSADSVIRLLLSCTLLVLTPPVLVAVVIYFDKENS